MFDLVERWARSDGEAWARQHPEATWAEIQAEAQRRAGYHYPGDDEEMRALRDIYRVIFLCAACPPGMWYRNDEGEEGV